MVAPTLDFLGGSAIVFIKLANFSMSQGHSVTVVTTNISSDIKKLLSGVRLITKTVDSAPQGIITKIIFLIKMVKKFDRKVDVINIHNFPSTLSVIFARKPVVWMCNEPPRIEVRWKSSKGIYRIKNWLLLTVDKMLVKLCVNKVVVADNFNLKRFQEEYNEKDCKIIPYGIDSKFFRYLNPSIRHDSQYDSQFIVLQVGVVTPEKNQLITINAFYEVWKCYPQIKLVFAGRLDANYFSVIMDRIKELGLIQKVVFLGNVSPEIIRELYRSCDVLIHPVESQGGWLSAFEGVSSGIPLIVSTKFTAAEIINVNKLGEATDDYVSSIKKLIHERPSQNELVRRSNWIRHNLSWDKFCSEFISLMLASHNKKS